MKIRKTEVLIIVEHRARELEAACLLKAEFERREKTVIIDSIFPNKEILPLKYSADIIFLPWAYNDNNMKFIKCFFINSPHAKIINLHYEQYSGQDEKNVCLPVGEARELYHVSWGEKFSKSLVKVGCRIENIITSGSIQLDFYREKFSRIALSRAELAAKYSLDENKKWVLFIANGYHLMNEQEMEKVLSIDINAARKKEVAIHCRKDFLEYVQTYISEHSNVQFIYRPHPVYADRDRNSNDIKDIKQQFPNNFKVISDLSIRNWVLAVDCCVSFHSTTIVDCYAGKTPYYLFRTKELSNDLDYTFLENYEYTIRDYAAFCQAVQGDNFDYKYLKERLNKYYLLEDDYAYANIVDFILSTEGKGNNFVIKKSDVSRNKIRAYVKLIIHRLAQYKTIQKILINQKDSRWFRMIGIGQDAFDDADVEAIADCIRKCIC